LINSKDPGSQLITPTGSALVTSFTGTLFWLLTGKELSSGKKTFHIYFTSITLKHQFSFDTDSSGSILYLTLARKIVLKNIVGGFDIQRYKDFANST
jgi:hypothetical protein